MYYRDEDPARTSSPDECFNSFMSDHHWPQMLMIMDFYEKRPLATTTRPRSLEYEKEQEALRKAQHDKQVDYFMQGA